MAKRPHVLIAGGGSLGNIYPGLSIARRLHERLPTAQVTLAGDGRAIERQSVRAAGLRYATVPRSDTPRRLLDAPGYVARNAAGWCVSHWLLRELEADLVVSLGGHAAGPLVRAARASGTPYVLVEQNSLPYPATRSVAKGASAVCLAYEETAARLPIDTPVRWTGGVVRPGYEDAFAATPGERAPVAGDPDRPRLVVLGGVGGASSLNRSTPRALGKLRDAARGWQVVHQSGDGWLTTTESLYRDAGVDAIVVSYLDELAHLARQSDLVVCRPGGSTLAELALAGLPAVLVPDARRHDSLHEANAQLANLRYGCPVIDERDGDLPDSLAQALGPLMTSETARDRLSERLAGAARPEATSLIADACCEALGVSAQAPRRLAA